jgi:hypothetical protein
MHTVRLNVKQIHRQSVLGRTLSSTPLLFMGVTLLLALALGGCKSKKELAASKVNLKRINAKTLVQEVDARKAEFPFLVMKGSMRYRGSIQNLNARYTFHLEKDQRLWGSFHVMGIEGGRFMVTRDSFFFLNRLEKIYMSESFARLNRQLGVNMDFDFLEDLLLGNLPKLKTPVRLSKSEHHKAPDLLYDYKTIDLLIRLDDKLLRPLLFTANQPLLNVDSEVHYRDLQAVDSLVVPHEVEFEVRAPRAMNVSLKHRQVRPQTEPLAFPFRIPDSYSRQRL